MSKLVKRNPYRVAFQWLIVALLAYLVAHPYIDKTYTADFEAYCPFGGLQAFSSYLASNSLACSMTTTQIFMGMSLLVGALLISKVFCSHICPIGTFTEWLGRIGSRLKINFVVKGLADRLLRVIKYALLFTTFYFSITSSELFCKTFDPYYAVFSGFGSDVTLSYAIMALFLAIPGSLFVRQFWCKYTCPLGAASNIFSFSYVFIGITSVYAILVLVAGLDISWIWLLATLSLSGMVLETTRLRFSGFTLFKVNREVDSCTSCKLCDKACPMAIKVSTIEKIQHVDCNMCGDCVASCPENNTLKIHRKSNLWLPGLGALILIGAGLSFASITDIPTISLKWGDAKQMSSAGIYEQSGLTSIKCFGSSMSFANHMKELPGVLGVETFVSDNSVKVYYDPILTSGEVIKRSIFTPVKYIFLAPAKDLSEISILEVGIDRFFDPNDAGLLNTRFSQNSGILSVETVFGEPVHAIIYYDNRQINKQEILDLIELKKVSWQDESGTREAKTDFKVAGQAKTTTTTQSLYLQQLYAPVKLTFNRFEEYTPEKLERFDFEFHDAAIPGLIDMPWYLLSHVSNNPGVVSFETVATDQGFMLNIQVVKQMIDRRQVLELMNQSILVVHMSDGTVQNLSNPFKF